MEKELKSFRNKNDIIINDHGVLFEYNFGLLIFSVALILTINDLIIFFTTDIQIDISFVRASLVIIISIVLVHYVLIRFPKKFKLQPAYFKFTDNTIEYHYFGDSSNIKKIESTIDIQYINSIEYCIIGELNNRFGRYHKLTPWQLYRQSSIGVHIGKITIFSRFVIEYILFVLPYRLWRLYCDKEPFYLLSKNIIIRFSNRNYFIVNIYSESDLKALQSYCKKHNIPIKNKTRIVAHLQNQGWFTPKEEIWTDNFKKGDEYE